MDLFLNHFSFVPRLFSSAGTSLFAVLPPPRLGERVVARWTVGPPSLDFTSPCHFSNLGAARLFIRLFSPFTPRRRSSPCNVTVGLLDAGAHSSSCSDPLSRFTSDGERNGKNIVFRTTLTKPHLLPSTFVRGCPPIPGRLLPSQKEGWTKALSITLSRRPR